MNVIDLTRLARELPAGFERLRGLMESTLDLHSARSDLRIAADFAARAQEILRAGQADENEPLQDLLLALVSGSVIFYVRATKSVSDHRRTFDIRAHLDEREHATHERLCKLRDDAIAHYGPGELGGDARLRSDYLAVDARGGRIVAISRHTYAAPAFLEELAYQTNRAVLIMLRLFHEREALLVEAMNEHATDHALEPAKRAALVDLGEAIGNAGMAQEILEGPQIGHRRLSG